MLLRTTSEMFILMSTMSITRKSPAIKKAQKYKYINKIYMQLQVFWGNQLKDQTLYRVCIYCLLDSIKKYLATEL